MRGTRSSACPMDALLKLLMGPWTTYILWILRTGGALRFGALKQQVAGVSAAHAVTGPHDIIAIAEAADVSSLGELVVQRIQSVPGVNRSLTSIVAD